MQALSSQTERQKLWWLAALAFPPAARVHRAIPPPRCRPFVGPDSAHWPRRVEASGMKVTLRRHAFDPDLAPQRPRRLARRGERGGRIEGIQQAVHRAAGAGKQPRDQSLATRSAEF